MLHQFTQCARHSSMVALAVFGVGVGAFMPVQAAPSGELPKGTPPIERRFATVWQVRGNVTAKGSDATARQL